MSSLIRTFVTFHLFFDTGAIPQVKRLSELYGTITECVHEKGREAELLILIYFSSVCFRPTQFFFKYLQRNVSIHIGM